MDGRVESVGKGQSVRAALAPLAFRAMLLALAAGLVAGAATLVRPSWLLFTPLAAMAGRVAGRPAAAGGGNPRWRHLVIGAGHAAADGAGHDAVVAAQ